MSGQPGTVAGKDAIREGKQKARETMAAAGVSTATPGASNSANGFAQSNGGPALSRKRSRDGSQLPADRRIATKEGSTEPAVSHDEVLLDRYIQRDMIHGAAMNDQAERSRELIQDKEREKEWLLHDVRQQRQKYPGTIFGAGYLGYGNRRTDGRTEIQYSANRPPPKGRRSKELYIPRKDNAQQAEQHEELVPVRLDLELDKLRLRDTFTWNLHEKLISPEQFTDYLLEDLKIPPEAMPEVSRYVRQELHEQTQSYYPHIIVEDGPFDSSRPYNEYKDDEMRIMVKLNITIGRITLIDQFEWDINNPLNSPEEFARHMALENALSGEFTTAIAHSIREQSQLYTKSLYITNHCFDGRLVEDPELRDAFLPAPLHGVFRTHQQLKDWAPYMYEMSEAELDRTELAMMREHRAQKRHLNRRGGPALPDLKERLRTVRSLLVHTVIPGAVETFENTGIPKIRRARGGRRGAARALNDDEGESDDLGTEDSGPDSPAPSMLNVGTTRTRGMRGAATAATAAMRAIGRSATPDSQALLQVQEPRSSARRSGLRDESVVADNDDDTLVVRLRVGKARLKGWWEDYQAKKRASLYPLSGYASKPLPAPTAKAAAAPAAGTPVPAARTLQAGGSATPQPSARAPSRNRKAQSQQPPANWDAEGRVEVKVWPGPDEPAVSSLPTIPETRLNTNDTCSSLHHPPGSSKPSRTSAPVTRILTSSPSCAPTTSMPSRAPVRRTCVRWGRSRRRG